MYSLLRKILFLIPPEEVHYLTMNAMKFLFRIPGMKFLFGNTKNTEGMGRMVAGIRFPNVVGMAAGFDKNALYYNELSALGFGFVEVGTVTPKPQDGNPKPRLFRLPKDEALINRMGFNNHGAAAIAQRLKKRNKDIIIGGNIGKNKITPNEKAIDDYLHCFEALFPYVDYFVVNISSPNTPNLRELQERNSLENLTQKIQEKNKTYQNPKPIFLKISPDISFPQLDDIVEVVNASDFSGIIATNTTIHRDGLKNKAVAMETGGLSGKPLTKRSLEIISYIKNKNSGLAVIASGGMMKTEDAVNAINAGADLVQLYTGFIYSGPSLISSIKRKTNL